MNDDDVWGKKQTDWPDVFKTAFCITFGVSLALGVLSLIGIPIYKGIASDNKVEHCYVEPITWAVKNPNNQLDCQTYNKGYRLKGFVPWGKDRILVDDIPDTDTVLKEAQKFRCEIK